MAIQGIDVSKHQGTIDFQEVAASGMRFCFCKGTEGADYVDPKVREYWRGLLATDIYRGLYHFARPDLRAGRAGGEKEGRNLVALAKQLDLTAWGTLPPVLDFEKYSESDSKDNIPWIQGWLDVVEGELCRMAAIYTGANVWKYEVGDTDVFADRPLWQVDYTETRSKPKTIAKGNWPWVWWQWSGGGDFAYAHRVPGINTIVDVNDFYGTAAELAALAMAPKPGTPVEPEDPTRSFRSIMPWMGLETAEGQDVKNLQGLLLANGYGPDGLVGADGRPDGIVGPKTTKALESFRESTGTPSGPVTGLDWWNLLHG